MTYEEALVILRKGKVVARRSSKEFAINCGVAIRTLPEGCDVAIYCVTLKGWGKPWTPLPSDVTCCDWEVVDAVRP